MRRDGERASKSMLAPIHIAPARDACPVRSMKNDAKSQITKATMPPTLYAMYLCPVTLKHSNYG